MNSRPAQKYILLYAYFNNWRLYLESDDEKEADEKVFPTPLSADRYKCLLCDHPCQSWGYLEHHMKTDHSEFRYVCDLCDKCQVTCMSSLERHMNTIHGVDLNNKKMEVETYTCDQCDKEWNNILDGVFLGTKLRYKI